MGGGSAEWRIFIPLGEEMSAEVQEVHRLLNVKSLVESKGDGKTSYKPRTDVYADGGSYMGIKLRGERKLEVKVREDVSVNAFGVEMYGKFKPKGSPPPVAETAKFVRFVRDALGPLQEQMTTNMRTNIDAHVLPGLEERLGDGFTVAVTKLRDKAPTHFGSSVVFERCLVRVSEMELPGVDGSTTKVPPQEWISICVEAKTCVQVESFLADKITEWAPLWDLLVAFGCDGQSCLGAHETRPIIVNGYPGFVESLTPRGETRHRSIGQKKVATIGRLFKDTARLRPSHDIARDVKEDEVCDISCVLV